MKKPRTWVIVADMGLVDYGMSAEYRRTLGTLLEVKPRRLIDSLWSLKRIKKATWPSVPSFRDVTRKVRDTKKL